MRLDKQMREAILSSALQAIKPPHNDFSVDAAAQAFKAWHAVWMPSAVREAFDNPAVRVHMQVEKAPVDFGTLVSWRSRRTHPECVREIEHLVAFQDVYEPIIEQLQEGKRVREKQWTSSRCPASTRAWLTRYYEFKCAKDKAATEIELALACCTTVASLIKKFPALEPYVTKPTANLPAIPVELTVFKRLTAPVLE